ncbi:MAG: ATP synthase F1 subunit gamma [Candidatus Dadabacteria bacterium]|nr:MAG: ATP synthase F1 subunit gamma [Candidatus Dadabacteria bacterium]
MAGLKEIKRRILSVKNTRKITYAMKLVSAAKLRKAQEAVASSRGYTETLNEILAELLLEAAGLDLRHPLMERHSEIKNVRLIIVGGSRGLCGAYNSNLQKKIDQVYKQYSSEHPGVTLSATLIGKKPAEHFRRRKYEYVKSYENLGEDAINWPVDDICREIENAFVAEEIDQVFLMYTKFKSALSQSVEFDKILPLDAGITESEAEEGRGLTIFEPSVKEVFDAVIPRIFRSRVRQACLDSKASEHGSRMTSMDSATKNAGELIDKLTLTHNKLRQAGITGELLDIMGGVEALK